VFDETGRPHWKDEAAEEMGRLGRSGRRWDVPDEYDEMWGRSVSSFRMGPCTIFCKRK
jgi:hypothetical protein